MADQPMYDRYAPHEKATIAALTPVESPSGEDQSTETSESAEASPDNLGADEMDENQAPETAEDGLEDLDKDELIRLARNRGVAIYGTKGDIIDRLRDK
jgi:hypothetical protein